MRDVATLTPGDTFTYPLHDPDGVTVTVLRVDDWGRDRIGMQVLPLWCRREDTREEGFIKFGPGAAVR